MDHICTGVVAPVLMMELVSQMFHLPSSTSLVDCPLLIFCVIYLGEVTDDDETQ